jgi:hypothetical protein
MSDVRRRVAIELRIAEIGVLTTRIIGTKRRFSVVLSEAKAVFPDQCNQPKVESADCRCVAR